MGQVVIDTVHAAWNAVGVPGGPVEVTALTNGQTVSGLAASTGAELHYALDVTSGASNLNFSISGGSGDADLYAKFGAAPTTSSYFYSSSSGSHKGWLEGSAGSDFDLYLYKWENGAWKQKAKSTSSSSSESISYSGSSGYYLWKVTSYSGSGSYSFWLDRP
jgi:hypothetical protein